MKTKQKMIKVLLFSFVLASTLTTVPLAQAELQVLPSRIYLSESQKTAQISLMHKGTKSARYRVDAVSYKMKSDGSLELVKDPTKAENSAVDYFRFSPRQVTVEPNIEQVIRLQLKWPEDAIPDADYTANLNIEAIEEEDESNAIRPSINAQAIPSEPPVSIPVIVRRGKPELNLKLQDFKTTIAADKTISYSVEVVKTGSAILHGDFVLLYFTEGNDKPTIVAQSNGVSSSIEKRSFTQTLSIDKFVKGRLVLEVREAVSDGGKVLATTSLETVAPPSSPLSVVRAKRVPSSAKRRLRPAGHKPLGTGR